MSLRKEVFQSKVLKRLYPSAHEQKTSLPASNAERLQPLPHKQTRNNRIAAVQGSIPKKVYTALPPPEGFSITCENDCLPASNPDPTDSGDNNSSSNSDGQESQKRRRRRRKRKVITSISTAETTSCSQSDTSNTSKSASMDCLQRTEKLSKNRKRKLKKKRHKEKLLALGLMPHTQALEFTYSQTGEEEEHSEELFHFLRSTHEIYLSRVIDVPYSLTAVPTLFSRLSDGTLPSAEVSRLCELKTLLTETKESLQTLLDEYRNTSVLTSNEVSVVCSLMEYWFNEILPMQRQQASAGHNVTQKAHGLFAQRVAVLLGALGIALSGYSSRQLTLHHRPSARFLLWASKPAISGENLEACSGRVSVDSASDAIREDMKH